MRPTESCWKLLRGVTFVGAAVAVIGCYDGNPAGSEEAVETVQSGLTTVQFDDSASPVHVQIKTCTTDVAQLQQTINCTVDSAYALVGGGAHATRFANSGVGGTMGSGSGGVGGSIGIGGTLGSVPVKASRALDGRTWQASSGHHIYNEKHKLNAIAVGVRLDGVNAATLRGMITRSTFTTSPPQSSPSSTVVNGNTVTTISGGAAAFTSGVGQYLTRSTLNVMNGWTVGSRDHLTSSPGQITNVVTTLNTNGIIEGFGKLDVAQRSGGPVSVMFGERAVTGTVTTGWAIAGYGGLATTTSGPGRLLTWMRDNFGPRGVFVASRDVGVTSPGSTTAYWSEVRRAPNSHGLCSQGGPLATGMDSCIATICAPGNDPFCCNTFWDSICVAEVTSMCGKSCEDYLCSEPSFTPAFWSDGGTVQFNNASYNYANNRRTDTFAQPGRASDESCGAPSCTTGTALGGYTVADGLVATDLSGSCTDGRSLVALFVAPNVDYIYYRKDSSGWSYKQGGLPPTNLDFSSNPIADPFSADRGIYTSFGGYFCTCSSFIEGGGHAVIQ